MVAFFIENQQRTQRKVGQFGAMTLFFFSLTQNSEKIRPTQKFCPAEKSFAPLEQRFSCGIGPQA